MSSQPANGAYYAWYNSGLGCLVIGLVCASVEGCSINNHGFVSENYNEDATSYLVTQEAWGGSLSTRGCDMGWILGHRKVTLIYAKADASAPKVGQKRLADFPRRSPRNPVDMEGIEPYAWIESNQGLMLNTNWLKFGISLGLVSRKVLSLPSDFEGSVKISQDITGDLKTQFSKTIINK